MANNSEIVVSQSIFRIGRVLSVNGREVRIKVDKQKNLSHIIYNGTLVKNISVGGYVKIIKGFFAIIAKVDSEYITEDTSEDGKSYSSSDSRITRILSVSLLGYLESNKFEKGVRELPLIDNECYLLSNDEFIKIHRFIGKDSDQTITIGTLSSDSFMPIYLGVNKLFSSHIGIFGNTGSGKSYTLAKVYRTLFETYKESDSFKANSKFLFVDFNGEYSGEHVMVSDKKIYNLSTRAKEDTIPLPAEAFLDAETLCIFANATEKTQKPFIRRCLELYNYINDDVEHFKNYLRRRIVNILCMSDKTKSELLLDYIEQIIPPPKDEHTGEEIGLRSDIAFHETHKYWWRVGFGGKEHENRIPDISINGNYDYEFAKGTQCYRQVENYTFPPSIIGKFIHFMYLRLIKDLLDNRAMNEHIVPTINKLKSVVDDVEKSIDFTDDRDFWDENNIVVVNLKDANQDTKKMIPLLISYRLYQKHKKEKKEEQSYLNLIIDEAHNILSYQSSRESDSWKDYRLEVFEEIIKEGRKFGVFLTLASQRPSDISTTIISQLHNYFIHRLVNDEDIDRVGRSISYLDRESKESLPILSTGVCVIAGQLTGMPVVVKIDEIESKYVPKNETIDIVSKWA
jgi:DNA helicase HerA-like ATPase